jgi:hypothetical protein
LCLLKILVVRDGVWGSSLLVHLSQFCDQESCLPMASKKDCSASSAFLKTTKKYYEAFARFTSPHSSSMTPIRESPQSSPAAASSSTAFFATPKEQIRAGFISCGQGTYDWSRTVPASENVMQAFKNQLCCRLNESPDVVFAPRGLFPMQQASQNEDSAAAVKRSRTGPFGYAPRSVGQPLLDDQDETTEEEISFHLSQDFESESVEMPPIQRCVSASLPPHSSSLRNRRRSISVETLMNMETASLKEGSYSRKIDTQGNSLFSDYRSPRTSSGRSSRRKRSIFDETEDPDDIPLYYSSSCSDNGSRCTSSLPFETAGVAQHNLGSMLGSPDLSMERLALAPPSFSHHALPRPPLTLRSHSYPLVEPHEDLAAPMPAVPGAGAAFSVNSSLFTPPRNRRGRSESFTDDLASTFSSYYPLTEGIGPPASHEMMGGMFTPISSLVAPSPSSTPRPELGDMDLVPAV